MANEREKRIAATKLAKKYGFQASEPEPETPPVGDATFPGCEYTDEEREFLVAMDRYKRDTGHKFPTWSEVLKVLKSLGYEKVSLNADCESTNNHADSNKPIEARCESCRGVESEN